MRIISRFTAVAFVTAALALGACASDEDLTADPTASDEAALAQQQDEAAADEAPVTATAQAAAAALSLSLSCRCTSTFAHCEGEAHGGTGSYTIKYGGVVVPNAGGYFQFGSGKNHGTVTVSARSGSATRTRSFNVSCNGGPGDPNL
jgi:hypothetical protein